MQRPALARERQRVQRGRVVDQGQLSLRGEYLDQLGKVLVGVGEAGEVLHLGDADPLQAFAQRLAVVDHVMCAECVHPLLGFRARGGTDHGQLGQRARQLHQDRANAAGRTDHRQRLALATAFDKAEPVEQQLPGGDGSQRQRGGGGVRARGTCYRRRSCSLRFNAILRDADAGKIEL
ncbi:hypothetical protein BXO8_05240 [Xanthomonas oryzae pv. oryzae]|nr:hypothetical protein BXO8_05240 [Xanthomonas oryzae pv. oryzae]OLK85687.1 hypothetical protein IXO1221_01410 [Xanthomonas oryzae pv. oryzae]OLK88886.1 hypothetical protein IXO884_19225 [Xanthomonas oryzae pv. oryzae]